MLCAPSVLAQRADSDGHSNVIYREKDASGIVRFTDQPRSPEAERHFLRHALRIAFNEESGPVEEVRHLPFIEIASPRHDEAVRDNQGSMVVQTTVSNAEKKHFATDLFLDESWIATSADGRFELQNLDRGTHRLRAELKAADGTLLATSESVTFHLLRYTIPALK